jgi:hypothetical protein
MLLFKLDMFCKHTECYLIMLELYTWPLFVVNAYTVFIVLSFAVCPSDSAATENQKYVSYYILVKTKHKKIRKQ